ncbi:MAG: SOS response-associated peptidase [Porticoccaceae bacterium]|nr:SOS response-associated peptidase [Porticoccaceae bacterium]
MCGRFTLHTNPRDIGKALGVEWPFAAWQPRFNIAPGTDIVGIRYDRVVESKEFTHFWWGYLPRWAGVGAPQPINAQAEHLESSRYFRGAFHHHRCLIPADGWYEWQPHVGGKRPHYITRQDHKPLYFAGIFETRADGNLCCAIVTYPAQGAIHDIHPRMPLVLDDDSLDAWLDPGLETREAIQGAVKPLSVVQLAFWRVSTWVNSVKNDDEALIQCLDPQG